MVKAEEVKQIQESLWSIYKDFLGDKDLDRYKDRANALKDNYEGDGRSFLCSMVCAWIPVAGGLAEDFRDGRETEGRTGCISYIQNEAWGIYQSFLSGRDMGKCNARMLGMAERCRDTGDKVLLEFCKDAVVAWAGVINSLADM